MSIVNPNFSEISQRHIYEPVFGRVLKTPLDLEHYKETSLLDSKRFIGTISGEKYQIIKLRKIKKNNFRAHK